MRILLVEDDECIAKTLETLLIKENYAVDIAVNGEAGWRYIETFSYDLILLDVVLPKLDGITLCRKVRSHHYQTPVLLITAQNSSTERVIGLDAGADDYMTKPFDLLELLARMRVLLRRGNSTVVTLLEWDDLKLDPASCKVNYGDRPLHLTPKEYRLLELFLRNPHQVFSRGRILEHLWGCEENPGEDTVTAHIKGLRQRLKQVGAPTDLIETVYGIGYRLKQLAVPKSALSNSASKVPLENDDSNIEVTPIDAEERSQKTKVALKKLWEKFKVQNHDRLQILERAIDAIQAKNLDSELLQQAKLSAHKLAGALGIFDLHEGSRLALAIEHALKAEAAPDHPALSRLIESLGKEVRRGSPDDSRPILSHCCPLLVIDDDPELVDRILKMAQIESFLVEEINLEAGLIHSALDACVLSFSFADQSTKGLSPFIKLMQQMPLHPVIVLTDREHLDLRVKLARSGIHAVFPKLTPRQVFDLIMRMRARQETDAAQVLMVDDDPQILAALRLLLEPWGLHLTTLEDTPQFWQTLQSCTPDLLILDVEMPHFNGIELCQVVRSAPEWNHLPVLFFTAHTDANTLHQVLAAGANDLIAKPDADSQLVHRILSQLERSWIMQSVGNEKLA
ncbi:MAG: response regulator [Leptolyngbyaceae cyanobacterium CSU_1_3]|nr:response regulator [Leptolyngbyaceae cyanobacterium CSU_1_3]